MARKLLYLSPQFPRNFIQFVLRLNELGVRVLGVGSDSFWQLPEELRRALHEYCQLDTLEDYRRLLDTARGLAERHGGIDRVESHTEYWLPIEAALREHLGIWGKKSAETALIQRKSLMKQRFREAAIAVVPGLLLESSEAAWQFTREHGYPVIAKPDIGVGAYATYRLNSDAELQGFLQSRPPQPYFLEEFIDGEIVTYDGLADTEGRIVYANSLQYGNGIMEVVNADDHVYYFTARAIDPQLEGLGRETVRAFDVREKFFHLEFFKRHSDGQFFALEVNIRPPGGLTVDMWNYADDIDLYRGWARLVAQQEFGERWARSFHVFYISRKDRFDYFHSHDDVLRFCGQRLCHWERIPLLFRNALGDSGYLVRVPTVGEGLEVVSFLHARH